MPTRKPLEILRHLRAAPERGASAIERVRAANEKAEIAFQHLRRRNQVAKLRALKYLGNFVREGAILDARQLELLERIARRKEARSLAERLTIIEARDILGNLLTPERIARLWSGPAKDTWLPKKPLPPETRRELEELEREIMRQNGPAKGT